MGQLRQALQACLAWERGRQDYASQSNETQPSGDLSPLAVDPQDLLAAISRQRLEIVLAPWQDRLGWPVPLTRELVQRARQQRLGALPLVAGAIEVLDALAAVGVRALLLKGPALALQTTGDATARGRGDLDVLVDPCQLIRAIDSLECLGFRRLPGMAPVNLASRWGRYARWVGYELPLQRRTLLIDLHWDLGPLRSSLPAFETLWQQRELLTYQGRQLATLGRRHSFLHSCDHAVKDRWISLRSLVDIERLARLLSEEDRQASGRYQAVRLSGLVAYSLTRSPWLEPWGQVPLDRPGRRALAVARWSQGQPVDSRGRLAWHPLGRLADWRHALFLARSPTDWIRTTASIVLLPGSFNDPETGLDLSLATALTQRLGRIGRNLANWVNS
jgi:hypothetical protein